MSITLDGSLGITSPSETVPNTFSSSSNFGFKNKIINGACVIDQRNAGASVTITNTGAITYTLDRWAGFGSVASKFSIQQNAGSVTPPVGFVNYLGVTSLSAYTVGAAEGFYINQIVEGYNMADLNWGTANAKTITISFWVRSSLTGTFGGALRNVAFDRSYPFTYTISAANTWEQKSVTVAGDTTGTWNSTNNTGINLDFALGSGSTLSGTTGAWAAGAFNSATGATSVVGTSGATFYITGVQLEKGSTATSFDYRPYGTELQLCQRYYQVVKDQVNTGGLVYSGGVKVRFPFKTSMRSAPTAVINTAGSFIAGNDYSANYTATTVAIGLQYLTTEGGFLGLTGFAGLPASGQFLAGTDATGTSSIGFGAEL